MKKIIMLCALLNTSLLMPAAAGAGGASSSSSSGTATQMLAIDKLQQLGTDPALFLQQLAQYIVIPGIEDKQKTSFDIALISLIGMNKWKHINAIIEEYGIAIPKVYSEFWGTHQEERDNLDRLGDEALMNNNRALAAHYYKQSSEVYQKLQIPLREVRNKLLTGIFPELMALYYTIYGQLMARATAAAPIPSNIPTPYEVQELYENPSAITRNTQIKTILKRF